MYRLLRLGLAAPGTLTLALALVPTVALAEGEPCTRDPECVAAEICLDGACAAAEQSLPTCTIDDDCGNPDEACADGVCKHEGVACRNPAGACWVEAQSGSCDCANGEGAGWSGGFDPDNPPEPKTDAQLQIECTAELVDNCGETAPMLPDSCTGDVLTTCEAVVAHSNAIAELCDIDVPDVNIAQVGACCDDFDAMAEYRDCVLAVELGDACPLDEVEMCGGGGATGGVDDGEQAGGKDDDDAATKGGCRISDGAPPLCTAALLVLVAATRRRRARAAAA